MMNDMNQHVLSLLIFLPIVTGVIMLTYHKRCSAPVWRYVALLLVFICFVLSGLLVQQFDLYLKGMQLVETVAWMPTLGIEYKVGVDGLSLVLIILNIFMTLIVILATWHSVRQHIAQYLAAFLILQGILTGVFAALNVLLFYVFWETSLIPMYLIIGIWGSDNRVYAAIKFFLYTLLGSVMMLLAFLYLAWQVGSFDLFAFYQAKIALPAQLFIFVALLLAFAVKVPMWPVHTWLPDAHTEAPAGGSIILAAILLKLGAYGLLRFSLPIVPDASQYFAWPMVILSLVAIVYIGLVAISQTDLKKLIAYSSVSHMGFVTLGFFVIYLLARKTGDIDHAALAVEGAVVVMVSHAFISGALFAVVGYIYDRMRTRMISDLGGLVNSMPLLATLFMLFAMANAGLPGTSGFVGEFMVIMGTIKAGFWITFIAASTLILGAAYTLWMYKRVVFGAVVNERVAKLKDIRGFELTALLLLAVMVLILGMYPAPLLKVLHPAVDHLLNLSYVSKL